MALVNSARWIRFCFPHGLIYGVLVAIIIGFVTLTIIFGSLWLKYDSYPVANRTVGYPPRLPNDGPYVQWTFLQMNDVYELLPLDQGRRGGLARVAYIRQLLKQENSRTITVIAGDLVSPSAIGTARVNGTALNGRQMIATMNTLGVDYMTFGNHEFDLSETNLLARMSESKFTWISSNVFRANTDEPFGSSVTHKLITIAGVRLLLIGLTIDGTGTYVRFIPQASLVDHTRRFLASFDNRTFDVVIAITHLDIAVDIELATKVPQIDLILGGHEHENYYVVRGTRYTPITKADANAFSVYIHRCAFNVRTRQFRVYSSLARVTSDVPEEKKTAAVANGWFKLGIEGFQALGYQPSELVSCLPAGLELDGRYESVTSTITLLSEAICDSLIRSTADLDTTVALINGGTIRIDDVLRGTITQYDVIRTLPFPNYVIALSVPGRVLADVLTTGMSFKGAGLFISYTGVQTLDGGVTWLDQGTNVASSGRIYRVATTAYVRENTKLSDGSVAVLRTTTVTQTRALVDYLKVKYPPC